MNCRAPLTAVTGTRACTSGGSSWQANWSGGIGDAGPLVGTPGDVIFVPSETPHDIRTVGTEPSIRITSPAPDIIHYYTDDPDAPPLPR